MGNSIPESATVDVYATNKGWVPRNQITPTYKGNIGKLQYNNKCVYRGSPLSAMLFVIYSAQLLEMYNEKLAGQYNFAKPMITARNEHSEHAYAWGNEISRFRLKGVGKRGRPIYMEHGQKKRQMMRMYTPMI